MPAFNVYMSHQTLCQPWESTFIFVTTLASSFVAPLPVSWQLAYCQFSWRLTGFRSQYAVWTSHDVCLVTGDGQPMEQRPWLSCSVVLCVLQTMVFVPLGWFALRPKTGQNHSAPTTSPVLLDDPDLQWQKTKNFQCVATWEDHF